MIPTGLVQSRRRFIGGLSLSAATSILRTPTGLAADGPLETTAVRIGASPKISICIAPQYVANELLRAEGFTDIRFVDEPPGRPKFDLMARGELDFSMSLALAEIAALDAGLPIKVIAGVHVGCFELFAREGIRNLAELKGRAVGLKASPPALLSLMAAHVGLDPKKDIGWVTDPEPDPLDLFTAGKIDAFLGFPPEPQELRARKVGHVILRTTIDPPWSQYFCCLLAGNNEYIRAHPVATKRVLRAILKAADMCADQPELVAQQLVDGGFTDRYDYALQTLQDVPYRAWRDYDSEDTIRFYALRMREAGFIKATPQKIIADGTDWRFFDEIRRELKV